MIEECHGTGQTAPMNQPQYTIDVPVLIIGGGPCGLLQSYFLSRLGIRSLVVERYAERLGAPKAHALSPRSLEICRQFGLDVRAIRRLGTKRKDAFWVNFLTKLAGESIGVLPYERMDSGVLEATPEMIHNIPQPVFEQFVTEQLLKATNTELRKGVSFVSLEQNLDEVTTTVEERATGNLYCIRSKYVVACDGARSNVREHLEIESEGEDSWSDETMMTIHFNANLRAVVGDRVGMLHWIFDPLAAGFTIAYDLSDNAVLISNFDSEKHPPESWNHELCERVLLEAIGEDIKPKVLSYRPWLLSRKVARSYRRGKVFLAGDAAHSFPPTGGLGLNSGIADVHNLAFKIAAVLSGHASNSILDTYESDRKHVAEVNSRQSVENGKRIFDLLKTLGTAGIDNPEAARANLFRVLHDPDRRPDIDKGIEEQREHFDNLNLHIGYVYGDTSVPEHASKYHPQFVPGARLPHAWISLVHDTATLEPIDLSYVEEMPASERAVRRYSALDLCSPETYTFILSRMNIALQHDVQLVTRKYEELGVKFNIHLLTGDFSLLSTPSREPWLKDSGIMQGGGLLVRPDQHILFVLKADTASRDLFDVIDGFLGTHT